MDGDGSRRIDVGFPNRAAINRLSALAKRWYAEHPALVHGAAEMAIGAALLSWGVHSGAIEMGAQLVGTASDVTNIGGLSGAASGAALGLGAAKLVGSIGIVGMGGAIGVPAAILAAGGAAALAALGYTAGDVAFTYLHSFEPQRFVAGSGALVVGLALIADGARRILGDSAVRNGLALVSGRIVKLHRVSADVIARSLADLTDLERQAATMGVAALAGLGGAAMGGAYAASTVTLFGSQALGAAALSVGLLSAPVWPVVLGGATAVVATGLLAKRLFAKR